MTISLLRELPELKIVVVHPPDEEGDALVGHLRRVGCMVSMAWPMPATVPPNVDVLFLLVEGESRRATEALLKSMPRPEPTVIAIVNYEDPTTPAAGARERGLRGGAEADQALRPARAPGDRAQPVGRAPGDAQGEPQAAPQDHQRPRP